MCAEPDSGLKEDFLVSGAAGLWSLELCSKVPLCPPQLLLLTSKLHTDSATRLYVTTLYRI